MKNRRIMLESGRNKSAINKEFYQMSQFDRNIQSLSDYDYNEILSAYSIFVSEMNECSDYRINVTINPIISNILCERTTEVKRLSDGLIITGDSRIDLIQKIDDNLYEYRIGYDIFDNNFMRVNTFKTGNTLNDFTGTTLYDVMTITKSMKQNITEDNGWVSILNKTKINNIKMFSRKESCEKLDLFPSRDFLLFKPLLLNGKIEKNWDYFFTYPYENYYDSALVTDQNNINGIPIIEQEIITNSQQKIVKIKTLYKNNLNQGDVIKLKRDDKNTNKTYLVYNVEDNYVYINMDKYGDLNNIVDFTKVRICKVIQGIDCIYYLRKFKKIPNYLNNQTNFDNEDYQLSFANNIYGDAMHQIQYVENVNTSNLKDNIGRPISEIFFTVIKRNEKDSAEEPSSLFTTVTSGIETEYTLSGYSNVRLINTVSNEDQPLETNITNTGSTLFVDNSQINDTFMGDIVEYNVKTVKETILTDIKHRFNTVKREEECDFIYHEIYGDETNILYNSDFFGSNLSGGTDYWYTMAGTYTKLLPWVKTGLTGNTMELRVGVQAPDVGYPYVYTNIPEILEIGQNYSLSYHVKSSNMNNIIVEIDNIISQEININSSWGYNSTTFVGDGKFHKLSFITTGVSTNIQFQIANVKIEKNSNPTIWNPNPIDPNGTYSFIKKTKRLAPNKEGYFYKPHYKIKLKNYSNIINSDKFETIKQCNQFETGITFNGEIKLITDMAEGELKSLIMKIDTTENIGDFSYIRITDELFNYINVQIMLFYKYSNTIIIPYIESFMGQINTINDKSFVFRKFNNIETPLYCQDTYDDLCYWREFLGNGEFDEESELKEELVYTNGNFYVNSQIIFYLKRQDPFGTFGLRSNTFPSDMFGTALSLETQKDIIKNQNTIC